MEKIHFVVSPVSLIGVTGPIWALQVIRAGEILAMVSEASSKKSFLEFAEGLKNLLDEYSIESDVTWFYEQRV